MADHARSDSPVVQAQLDRFAQLSPGRDILGLERITALLALFENPHHRLPPVYHVAGTNGKGSTCAFLRASLEAAGQTVHVYTSPHLVRFNERIRLAGHLIDDSTLASLLAEVLDAAQAHDLAPSFFEATTAAALLAFSRTPADACVIEVGLGGRLDATNVVTPVVCGIAQVGIDHQAFLGETLVEIAAEKAGIAKRGVSLICLAQEPAAIAAMLMAASLVVTMIWVAVAFTGAVRDFRGITASFAAGLGLALVAAVAAAVSGAGAAGITAGFLAGLTITLAGLASRVLASFPQPVTGLFGKVGAIGRGLVTYWSLALGGLLGAAGVWIDKWVFWFSAAGETVGSGLAHAPVYDSTMFIASLSLIPALAAFVMRLETGFFERYQQYYATISEHGTLDQIEAARRRLAAYTLDNLVLVTLVQAGLAAILVLTAPIIIDALGLQFRQIAILRYGALGALFQFVFIAATAMLLFFDRRFLFVATQAGSLALAGVLTAASLAAGEDYYGVGYFVAALVSALIAFAAAAVTLERLNFLTFIGNNPTITGASGSVNPLVRFAERLGRRIAARRRRVSDT